MRRDGQLTRAEFVRRAAGTGAGLAFAAAGGPVWELLGRRGADAFAATAPETGVHRYVTRPDLRPPVVSVLHSSSQVADGHLFLAPLSGPGQRGTLIVDNDGLPVYFHPTTPVVALNFRTAVYRGKPVLTWWEGKTEHGLGTGTHVILDQSYRLIQRFKPARNRPSDLHEFIITPRGTALVTAWETVEADLTSYGGPKNGSVIGGVVQELELPSGRLLFEWRSLDHVGLDESHAGIGPSWDYFHINSIELDSDGNYLVSARNTWGVYKIDRETGRVIWRLGGKRSDFQMGPGTVFAWQHDARHHDGDRYISLFNDGAAPAVQPQSQGLVIELDNKNKRATLHRRYAYHRQKLLAHALGSVQILPNRNVLVGWGTEPFFTEYTEDGAVVWDARLPKGGQNYRTLRLPWVGVPIERPKVAARRIPSGRLLHASWNGSTEVASWRFDTGTSPSTLQTAATKPRTGFETKLAIPPGHRYAAVTALDARGAPLRTSPVTKL